MARDRSPILDLELPTAGENVNTLVVDRGNLEKIDAGSMAKHVFDPPKPGQTKGPVELALGFENYVGEVANKKIVVYKTTLNNGTYAQGQKINALLTIPAGTYLFTFSLYLGAEQKSLYVSGAIDNKNVFVNSHSNVITFNSPYDVYIAFTGAGGGTIAYAERASVNFIKID